MNVYLAENSGIWKMRFVILTIYSENMETKFFSFRACNEAKEHVDFQHPNMPTVVEVDTIEKKLTGPNSESLI